MAHAALEPEARLASLAARGGWTAAALAISRRGASVARAETGLRRLRPARPIGPTDLFDAASLTKPFVATLALRLDERGALPLDAAIGDLLPAARPALARRSLESLLRHRSGLVAWYPMEKLVPRSTDPSEPWLAWLAAEAPLGAPPGTYSDLGYLLWGFLAERTTGKGLGALLRREVTGPLGIEREATERPAPARAVDCALDGRREVALAAALGLRLARRQRTFAGVPQDGNARRLGRLAGHAGLFLSTRALAALAGAWLRPGTLLSADRISHALEGPRGDYALGWARRRGAGSAGRSLSATSFGHAGFTGGSLWIDPARELTVALLAHRRSTAIDANPLRRDLHAWAVERWCGPRSDRVGGRLR